MSRFGYTNFPKSCVPLVGCGKDRPKTSFLTTVTRASSGEIDGEALSQCFR